MNATTTQRRWLRIPRIAVAMVVFLSNAVLADIAGYPPSVTAHDAREVAMLPEYCKYAQLFRDTVPGGNDPAQLKRWTAIMGNMFVHIHHYCWGMMKTNRALVLARSKEDRQHYLSDSINEFDYVINHANDDFVLLPEVLTRRGENLVRLGRGPEAVRDLKHAIELKRDYWPPYVALAELYKSTGDVGKARDVVKQGLASSPNARALQRELAQLSSGKNGSPSEEAATARGRP